MHGPWLRMARSPSVPEPGVDGRSVVGSCVEDEAHARLDRVLVLAVGGTTPAEADAGELDVDRLPRRIGARSILRLLDDGYREPRLPQGGRGGRRRR
jgi:hypothetical protein